MNLVRELQFIEQVLRKSGRLTLDFFGKQFHSHKKEEKSQIVTEVDIASEKLIVAEIEIEYKKASIIAEESGFLKKDPNDLWIIDPIDGTSNFANNLPWFGVMIAHLVNFEVVSSGIYLPVTDEMFLGQKGAGSFKNGKKLVVKKPQDLSSSLIAFGTDGSEQAFSIAQKAKIYAALLPNVLNIRTTNCAADYVYAAEGKLGGLINLENKIWDIAPIIPIATEAGCTLTDIFGKNIDLRVDESSLKTNFNLMFAHPLIHKDLLNLIKTSYK